MKMFAKRPVRKMRPAVVPARATKVRPAVMPARTMTTRSMSRDLKNAMRPMTRARAKAGAAKEGDSIPMDYMSNMTIEKQDKRRPVFSK